MEEGYVLLDAPLIGVVHRAAAKNGGSWRRKAAAAASGLMLAVLAAYCVVSMSGHGGLARQISLQEAAAAVGQPPAPSLGESVAALGQPTSDEPEGEGEGEETSAEEAADAAEEPVYEEPVAEEPAAEEAEEEPAPEEEPAAEEPAVEEAAAPEVESVPEEAAAPEVESVPGESPVAAAPAPPAEPTMAAAGPTNKRNNAPKVRIENSHFSGSNINIAIDSSYIKADQHTTSPPKHVPVAAPAAEPVAPITPAPAAAVEAEAEEIEKEEEPKPDKTEEEEEEEDLGDKAPAEEFEEAAEPPAEEPVAVPESVAEMTGEPPVPGWRMTTYRAPHSNLERIPHNLKDLLMIGSSKQEWIKADGGDFGNQVPGTPHDHFVWRYDGFVHIEKPGNYLWCTASDDGSTLDVNGERVVNNDGLHGTKEVCAHLTLASGDFPVVAFGFERGGHAHMTVKYAGPDTGGGKVLVPSVKYPDAPLAIPYKGWRMTTYRGPHNMDRTPRVEGLTPVGSTYVQYVHQDGGQFSLSVAGTPHDHFVWRFEGVIKIEKEGEYKFCTASDDGSLLFVKGAQVVDNDGLHGTHERCGTKNLEAGEYPVVADGFERGGHAHMDVSYQGPDTGGQKMMLRSLRPDLN